MTINTDDRTPLVRFLDAFLREENIKWMLGIGLLILFGSSLRLVAVHWHEYTPVWKYLILLAYTGAVYAGGHVTYFRLGLQKTGTVLLALTVLLIPLTFLVLHWIRPEGGFTLAELLRQAGLVGLLVGNFSVSAVAAYRIFRHFLRRSQPTFLVSYLTLCLAGAILPAAPESWAPVAGLLLWGVFAVGVVKVNRHVFWLTEEHSLPRICGFFPIALLASQFLTVFLLALVSHIERQWLGLGCAMVALPVLLTADAVVQVFQQRTGNLVRPLPWNVTVPLTVGCVLCVAGLLLAVSVPRSLALVPTAVLVAGAFGLMAHRLQLRPFVWGMLLCVVVAYQYSPVYFLDLARAVSAQGAAAVKEHKLPIAFYGLTYLPLIAGLSVAGTVLRRRGNPLFAGPVGLLAWLLPCLLLATSFLHAKATFPVGLVLTGVFIGQWAAGDQRARVPAYLAWVTTAFGLRSFVNLVLGWTLPVNATYLSLSVAGGLLLIAEIWPERWSLHRATRGIPQPTLLPAFSANTACLVLVGMTSGIWLIHRAFLHEMPWSWGVIGLLSVLWIGLAVARRSELVVYGALAFPLLAGTVHTLAIGVDETLVVQVDVALLSALWLLSYRLDRFAGGWLARPFRDIAYVGMSGMLCLITIPLLILCQVFNEELEMPLVLLTIPFAFDAARRLSHRWLTVAGFLALLLTATVVIAEYSGLTPPGWLTTPPGWLTGLIWTGLSIVALPVATRLQHRATESLECAGVAIEQSSDWNAIAEPLQRVACLVFVLVAGVALGWLTWPERGVAVLALAALGVVGSRDNSVLYRQTAGVLAHWHLLLAIAMSAGFTNWGLVLRLYDFVHTGDFVLPNFLAMLTAISLLIVEFAGVRRWCESERLPVVLHRVLLWTVTGWLLLPALGTSVEPGLLEIGSVVVTFGCLSGVLLLKAYREQRESYVWCSQGVIVVGVGYLLLLNVFTLGTILPLYLALVLGLTAAGLGALASRFETMRIFSRPLQQTGFWLPMLTLPLAVARHCLVPVPEWQGVHSLPLFAAGAFYGWMGYSRQRRDCLVAAAVLVNVSLCLLWRDLRWSDPQLFLIPLGVAVLGLTEVLKRDIPHKLRSGLRYIGALTILVSPVFDIVQGSWLHMFSLMLLSVGLILAAIGLRVRAWMFVGTAFLVADLVAMLLRNTIDRPNLLWILGSLLGGGVILLAAICERHREELKSRLRMLAAELELWQ